jgi:hypothetical protein
VLRIDSLLPIAIHDEELKNDTPTATNDEGKKEKWSRDQRWCIFPAECNSCGQKLTVVTPIKSKAPSKTSIKPDN